jgi:hypothetical protein
VLFIREQDRPAVADLIDWLMRSHREGYRIANSVERLAQMKDFIGGGTGRLELPGRTEHVDHPHRRHAVAVLPDVLGDARLGHHRTTEVRTGRS